MLKLPSAAASQKQYIARVLEILGLVTLGRSVGQPDLQQWLAVLLRLRAVQARIVRRI